MNLAFKGRLQSWREIAAGWLSSPSARRAQAATAQPLLTQTEVDALISEAYAVADDALRHPDVQCRHAGDMRSIHLGQGLDFEESRLYQRGDDLRGMDWRTTARTGKAYIKVFREEHLSSTHIVVDRSTSMRFATRKRLKVAQAARVAILSAFAAVRKGASVGGSVVQPVRISVPPATGSHGALRLLEALLAPAPPLGSEAGAGLAPALELLEAVLARGSKLVIVSDLAGFDSVPNSMIGRLALRYEVVPVIILDPAELALPDMGAIRFAHSINGKAVWIDTHDTALRGKFYARQQAILERLKQSFMNCGMHLRECQTTTERLPYV